MTRTRINSYRLQMELEGYTIPKTQICDLICKSFHDVSVEYEIHFVSDCSNFIQQRSDPGFKY